MSRARLVLLLLALAAPAAAQDSTPPRPPAGRTLVPALVHYGKWAAAASAVAFTAFALREHARSNDVWDQLVGICRANNLDCVLGADGRYENYQAELLYQKALYFDGRARRRIVVGQLSLLAAVGLFVADLRTGAPHPGNVIYKPVSLDVAPAPGGATLALRIAF